MQKYIWNENDAALIGTMSDRALCRKLNISWAIVRAERLRRGIKKFSVVEHDVESLKQRVSQMTDEELSKPIPREYLSVKYSGIFAAERKRRGLPSYGSKRYHYNSGTLKATLVKTALGLSPRPSLSEVADVFHVSREWIRKLGEQ